MANEGNGKFEIPGEMRAFAEKSVEQAKQAFDGFISAAKHAVNTAESQAQSARAGAKEIGALAIGFTQRNVATGVATPDKTQVLKGLALGDIVITDGGDRLTEGAKVTLPGAKPGAGGGQGQGQKHGGHHHKSGGDQGGGGQGGGQAG